MISLYGSQSPSSNPAPSSAPIRLYPDAPSPSKAPDPATAPIRLYNDTPAPIPAPAAPVAPTAPLSPTTSPSGAAPTNIPANALKGSLGGGYGTSNVTDSTSGKPLLTYENTKTKSSQLLSDRTAPTFDPTVPQKIDPVTLHNPRMKNDISTALRKQFGATAFD